MLIFKIFVIVGIVMAIFALVLCVHNIVVANKVLGSMRNWAEEVDRNVNRYIQQQFAIMRAEENNNNDNNLDKDGND